MLIEDDKRQYTKTEMQAILNGDDSVPGGNGRKTRAMQLRKTLMAFGLLGFVKFTQVLQPYIYMAYNLQKSTLDVVQKFKTQ